MMFVIQNILNTLEVIHFLLFKFYQLEQMIENWFSLSEVNSN